MILRTLFPLCPVDLFDLFCMFQHFMKMHAEKKHKCDKCSNSYGTIWDLKRHIEDCGKTFQCTCGCPYASRTALLSHIYRTQHEIPIEHRWHLYFHYEMNRKFNCSVCVCARTCVHVCACFHFFNWGCSKSISFTQVTITDSSSCFLLLDLKVCTGSQQGFPQALYNQGSATEQAATNKSFHFFAQLAIQGATTSISIPTSQVFSTVGGILLPPGTLLVGIIGPA